MNPLRHSTIPSGSGTALTEKYLKTPTVPSSILNFNTGARTRYPAGADSFVKTAEAWGHTADESYSHDGETYQNDLTDSQVIDELLRSIGARSTILRKDEKEGKTDEGNDTGEGRSGVAGRRPPQVSEGEWVQFLKDKATLAQRLRSPEFRFEYDGNYVVVYKGNVVDHDTDRGELLERIDEKYGAIPVYIGRVGIEQPRVAPISSLGGGFVRR